LLGDTVYGGPPASHFLLHAWTLTIPGPVRITATPPAELVAGFVWPFIC
jgi:hypothetical protein